MSLDRLVARPVAGRIDNVNCIEDEVDSTRTGTLLDFFRAFLSLFG